MDNIIGTQLYSKEGENTTPIYPKSDAKVIEANKAGTKTTVQNWLDNLTTSIGQITENAITLKIKISYAQTAYKNLNDVKDIENWGENFVQPDAEFPYTWKKTEIKASSNSSENSATSVSYELASISSQFTQTLYTARSADTKEVTIVYNTINIQGVSKPYYNDTLENILKISQNKGIWSEFPVAISATNPNGYIATRTRTNTGEWGAFNIVQNAKWAYNSIPVYKYKVTETIDVPSVIENSDDYSNVDGWKNQITESFTGYLWMINATIVNNVYQLNGSKVWSSPTLISIVK